MSALLWWLVAGNVLQYLVLARTTYARFLHELSYGAWMAPRSVLVGVSLVAGVFWPVIMLALAVSWVAHRKRRKDS